MTSLSNDCDATSTVEVVPGGPVVGSLRPPGSKSLTNRAMICAGFASSVDDASNLTGALRSEDTEVMADAIRQIGGDVTETIGGTELTVRAVNQVADKADPDGLASVSSTPIELFIANSGTTIRFLSAALSACGGHYRLHGVHRMHERPIGDLVDAIASVISGSIAAESPNGCPPVMIHSSGWKEGRIRVKGNVSSQYLSGLMMAAPICGRETRIEVVGELVSRPYVEMTAAVMRSFGSDVTTIESGVDDVSFEVRIGKDGYQPTSYAIEPDASAASYPWAAAAISGGRVTVEGLSADAMQGDVGFVDVLEKMGCMVERSHDSITVQGQPLRGVDVDMNAISDTVQTIAIVALFADGPTRVRGVAHNRFKETDRIGDLAKELRKVGATIDEHEDGLTIHPLSNIDAKRDVTLDTYHDHRMAMSFALLGLRLAGVRIAEPSCTAKTYPEYWADLETLIGRSHIWRP